MEKIFSGKKESPDKCDVSVDEALHIISNVRRRRIIRVLDEMEEGERLSRRELTKAIEPEDDAEYKSIYVSVHQSHMEDLIEAKVLTCDATMDGIQPGENLPNFVAIVEQADKLFEEE